MSMHKHFPFAGAVLLTFACAGPGHVGDPPEGNPKLGRPASQDIIRQMDLTVAADGTGLPSGSGSVAEGRATYDVKCAACHGPAGGGGAADRLTGGVGSLTAARPIKTVASYWPYAPTVFDYIRRAMPLTAPQSLEDKEVYGLVAYLLSIDGIVAGNTRLDGPALSRIRMPNRDGFVSLANQRFDGNIERVKSAGTTGE
ncbi:MAG: cytochrome c class [Novosphingobium sp.]|nr:cytochrome c class [Novosphingobium sp.]